MSSGQISDLVNTDHNKTIQVVKWFKSCHKMCISIELNKRVSSHSEDCKSNKQTNKKLMPELIRIIIVLPKFAQLHLIRCKDLFLLYWR